MATLKKKIKNYEGAVPFDSKGLQHYPDRCVWVESKPFEAILTLSNSVTSGRSAKYLHWEDENGKTYPMFVKDMVELACNHKIDEGVVTGIWGFSKRGTNFGIKWLGIN